MKWRDILTGLTVVTEPAFEPASRAEAKWQARIDQDDDDHLIDGYIVAARRQVEKDSGIVLVDTIFDLTIEAFPSEHFIPFPRWPLQSIASVTSYDGDDTASTLAASKYFVDTVNHRLILNDDESWPSDLRDHNAGIVRFTAGDNGAAVTVSTLTRSGTTATATATAHGFSTGDRLTIHGANQDEYSGTFTIVKTDTNTFTFTVVSGTPLTPATGTITARNLKASESLRLALFLLIAHFAQRREVAGKKEHEWPQGYSALIGGTDRHYAMA